MATRVDRLSRLYGERLRGVRKERGLRQADVAERLGMSAGGYSSIERGAARMFVSDLDRYAGALGVDPGYLGRRLGICGDSTPSEIRLSECADMLSQLEGEDPEVVEGILLMWRTSLDVARRARLAREN